MPLEADELWQIESGVVRSLTWDEEGRTITLGFWGAGDVIGQPLSRIQPYEIESLTSVTVCQRLPIESNLQQVLLPHIWKSQELLCIVHQLSVTDRLLSLLQWLAREFGQSTDQGWLLGLRLTHQDLADTIGVSRVTVTVLLNQFEQQGILQRLQRTLILKF